jgi:hypothetical protein
MRSKRRCSLCLQFALLLGAGPVLHRPTSLVIHRLEWNHVDSLFLTPRGNFFRLIFTSFLMVSGGHPGYFFVVPSNRLGIFVTGQKIDTLRTFRVERETFYPRIFAPAQSTALEDFIFSGSIKICDYQSLLGGGDSLNLSSRFL